MWDVLAYNPGTLKCLELSIFAGKTTSLLVSVTVMVQNPNYFICMVLMNIFF